MAIISSDGSSCLCTAWDVRHEREGYKSSKSGPLELYSGVVWIQSDYHDHVVQSGLRSPQDRCSTEGLSFTQ